MKHLHDLDVYYSREENWKRASGESLESIGDLFLDNDYAHRARHFYELSTRRDPRRVSAHFKLGSLCVLMRDYDRAARAYDNVLDVDPTNCEARFSLGRVNVYRERLGDAYRHLTAWMNMTYAEQNPQTTKREWATDALRAIEQKRLAGNERGGTMP